MEHWNSGTRSTEQLGWHRLIGVWCSVHDNLQSDRGGVAPLWSRVCSLRFPASADSRFQNSRMQSYLTLPSLRFDPSVPVSPPAGLGPTSGKVVSSCREQRTWNPSAHHPAPALPARPRSHPSHPPPPASSLQGCPGGQWSVAGGEYMAQNT